MPSANRQLHLLTSPPDPVVQGILDTLRKDAAVDLEVVDLNAPDVDYTAVLEKIFAADNVSTW